MAAEVVSTPQPIQEESSATLPSVGESVDAILFRPQLMTRPSIPLSTKLTGPLFDTDEPVIERLKEVAKPKKTQPVAGWVGIQALKEINVEVPPECLLYEGDYFKFQLGKMPPYRDYPQVIPKDCWQPPNTAAAGTEESAPGQEAPKAEVASSKSALPTPKKAQEVGKKGNVTSVKVPEPHKKQLPLLSTPKKVSSTSSKVEALTSEVREFAEDQKRVNPELPPPSAYKKKVPEVKGKLGIGKGKDEKNLPAAGVPSVATPKKKPSVSTQQTQRK